MSSNSRSGETKRLKVLIEHVIKNNKKDWLSLGQDNMSELSNMSACGWLALCQDTMSELSNMSLTQRQSVFFVILNDVFYKHF
jgi:D-arabinose 5-phosphate isomerase GutQ